MSSEEKADRAQVDARESGPRKPYVKPVLRRLGTVRELTHNPHPSTGK
jgi:hypothetical protein